MQFGYKGKIPTIGAVMGIEEYMRNINPDARKQNHTMGNAIKRTHTDPTIQQKKRAPEHTTTSQSERRIWGRGKNNIWYTDDQPYVLFYSPNI